MTRCKRCLFDSSTPGISFNEKGVCNYCDLHDKLVRQFPSGRKGARILKRTLEEIKNPGKRYDCIIGISGGLDSSFMLHLVVSYGLRPLAVHFDNGWDTEVSKSNMHKMCEGLEVDLIVHDVDNEEYNNIYKAFMSAGLPDVEACTDIGLMACLYLYANKYKLKHIFIGHSFRHEGISPLGWSYMDGRYIASVYKRYTGKKLKSYPNLTIGKFIKYMLKGIQRVRPLYYVDWDEEEVKGILSKSFGWEDYNGKHRESQITDFVKNYWIPARYGINKGITEYAGKLRSGLITREEADRLARDSRKFIHTDEILEKLNINKGKLLTWLTADKKSYKDFKNYKSLFEFLRPFFWLMKIFGRVPESFYHKYCKKQ